MVRAGPAAGILGPRTDATDGARRATRRGRGLIVFSLRGRCCRSTGVITRPRPDWIDVIDGAGILTRVNPKSARKAQRDAAQGKTRFSGNVLQADSRLGSGLGDARGGYGRCA